MSPSIRTVVSLQRQRCYSDEERVSNKNSALHCVLPGDGGRKHKILPISGSENWVPGVPDRVMIGLGSGLGLGLGWGTRPSYDTGPGRPT